MAALNFPNPSATNPDTGNPYSAGWYNAGNGVTYVYSGNAWNAATVINANFDDLYVNEVGGDHMEGSLTIGPDSDANNATIDLKADGSATFADDVQMASQNGGPLAGFRNVLINGNLTINQRNLDIASVATGEYGQDRWKKTAGGMTQIIEAGNFELGATYTLSGTGITTQQLTAPASGHWTLPDVPVTARKIQLEPGPVATPFEHRPIETELGLCQRYFVEIGINGYLAKCNATVHGSAQVSISLPVPMRMFRSGDGRILHRCRC